VEEVCAGLDAAWRFFGGVPKHIILDNASATVIRASKTDPGLHRAFRDYTDGRGLFVAQFDEPFTDLGAWENDVVVPGGHTADGGTTYGTGGFPPPGLGSGAYVGFDSHADPVVHLRVGISYVSLANAELNLEAENPTGTPFDAVKGTAHRRWDRMLGRVKVAGGTADQLATFYTALYHTFMGWNIFSDVNGEYWGLDQRPHTVRRGQDVQYATFSGWDTYRSQVQLVALLFPDIASDYAQSLFNQAQENGGAWDRWTHASGATHVMSGDPSAPAIAGMVAFGATDFDVRGAFESLVRAATRCLSSGNRSCGRPIKCNTSSIAISP